MFPFPSRRTFIGSLCRGVWGLALWGGSVLSFSSKTWAKNKKRVLSPETRREDLVNENPADLDARQMEPTPLNHFSTMGLTEHPVDLAHWTLKVEGLVRNPLRLTYGQLKGFPPLERKVLMICPGFFANQGLWKGVSIGILLQKALARPEVTHVTIRGPEGPYSKTERFPLKDVLSDKIFLAYQVNGVKLPEKHGFPLRLVVEDSYGDSWIKYVDSVKAEKITSEFSSGKSNFRMETS